LNPFLRTKFQGFRAFNNAFLTHTSLLGTQLQNAATRIKSLDSTLHQELRKILDIEIPATLYCYLFDNERFLAN
jgi:hypothetical protein